MGKATANWLEYDFLLLIAESKFYLQQANAQGLTHTVTHTGKRAGGDNGTESTKVADVLEQKCPKSTGKRYIEGRQSVGKN